MKTAKIHPILLSCVLGLILPLLTPAQCISPINSFPYNEDFESGPGGWASGGTSDDWTLGTPAKSIIAQAGSGTQCWITGGLTTAFYNFGERSYVQSPCFDFTNLDHPLVHFKLYYETEYKFDGANFQYSIDGGLNWTNLGADGESVDCHTKNWYNYGNITNMTGLASPAHGWCGNSLPTSGSCQGGNGSLGWVDAEHCMSNLANQPQVIFRFTFGAGTTCNAYDGFAFDMFTIEETPVPVPDFSIACAGANQVAFTDISTVCPTGWTWDFGDAASGSNSSFSQNPNHTFSATGTFIVKMIASNTCSDTASVTKTVTILSATDTIRPESCEGKKDGSFAVYVSPSGSYQYSWNTTPVQNSSTASGLSAGIYTVSVTGTPETCPFTLTDTVHAGPPCEELTLTNVLTPNTDGKNDGYFIIGLDKYPSNKLTIFNRWGKLVYEKDNYVNGTWKGMNDDGTKLSEGTYYVIFEATGAGITKKSWVKILNIEN